MEMLPTDRCAMHMGAEGIKKRDKHLAKVCISMQFVKLLGLMCVHCI